MFKTHCSTYQNASDWYNERKKRLEDNYSSLVLNKRVSFQLSHRFDIIKLPSTNYIICRLCFLDGKEVLESRVISVADL